jgi:hypothetical protein
MFYIKYLKYLDSISDSDRSSINNLCLTKLFIGIYRPLPLLGFLILIKTIPCKYQGCMFFA